MTIRVYQHQVQVLYTPASGILESAETQMALLQEVQLVITRGGFTNLDAGMDLQQDVNVFGYEYPATEMGLEQTVIATFPRYPEFKPDQNLDLQSEVTFKRGDRSISIEHEMGLTQKLSRSHPITVETIMDLGQEMFDTKTPSSDLDLQSDVNWGYGKDGETIMDLQSVVDVEQTLRRESDAGLGLEQACTWFIESACVRKQFNSFHGTGGVAPSAQKLNYTNQFHLFSLDDGTKVELRNPETDNRRRYAFNRINRTLFDGTPDVYADDDWVTNQTQVYTIVATKRDDLDEVFTFLLDNLGREVIVKDWKGVTWIVIITNPGEVYTEDGEGRWTIDFEVVGEAVDGEYVVTHSGLVQDPSRAGSIYRRSATSETDFQTHLLHQPFPIDAGLGLVGTATYEIVSP